VCVGGKLANISRYFRVNDHVPWVEWVQTEKENKVSINLKDRG